MRKIEKGGEKLKNLNNKCLVSAILTTMLMFSTTLQFKIIPTTSKAQLAQSWVFEAWEGQLIEYEIKAWWEPPDPNRSICIWAEGLPPFAAFEPVCGVGSVIGALVIAPDFGDAGSYHSMFYFGESLGVPEDSESCEIIVYAPAPPDEVLIEKVTVPENLTSDLIAFRWPEPLKAGDVVTPSVFEHGHQYVVEPNRTVWFYWINDCPYAMFAHDTRYVFMDAETGEYEVFHEGWPPVLNGIEMWPTSEEFWNRTHRVHSTTYEYYERARGEALSSDVDHLENWGKTSSYSAKIDQSVNRALIIESPWDPTGTMKNASELCYELLLNFGYSDDNIVYLAPEPREYTVDLYSSKENVSGTIENLANTLNGGDTLWMFLFAHGGVWSQCNGYVILKDKYGATVELNDTELEGLLRQMTDGVNITVVIESCYSGSFMDDLWKLDNVKVMITSTDWKSISYTASMGLDPGYDNWHGITDWVWNDTNWHDEGGEFSSGLMDGLNQLKDQFLGGEITLGCLYVKGFIAGKNLDAGYRNGDVLKNHSPYYPPEISKPNPLLITVFFEGDITRDGKVNILDVFRIARAWDTEPGHPRWIQRQTSIKVEGLA